MPILLGGAIYLAWGILHDSREMKLEKQKLLNTIQSLRGNNEPKCPSCDSTDVSVKIKQSTSSKHKNEISKRLHCNSCGKEFNKYEKPNF